MFPDDLTWLCHICRDERPDNRIGVAQHQRTEFGDVAIVMNVRYCTDRPDCTTAAYHCPGCDLHPVIDGVVVPPALPPALPPGRAR